MERKTLFKVIGLVIIIGVFVGIYMYMKPASTASTGKADFKIQPVELLSAFEADMAESNEKYIGKVIRFNRTVSRIEGDSALLITLSTPEEDFEAQCGFDKSEYEKSKKVAVGDQVIIQGSCDGVDLPEEDDILADGKYISFSRCSIFDAK